LDDINVPQFVLGLKEKYGTRPLSPKSPPAIVEIKSRPNSNVGEPIDFLKFKL